MIGYISKYSQRTGRLLLRRSKTTKSDVDPLILKKLDEEFLKFVKSDSKSLLKKHLTLEIFKALRTKQTNMSTLMDCIQSGLTNYDSNCGIYAPDPDAYKEFADIFDPIIEEYHFGFKKTDQQPPTDFGNPCIFGDLDPFRNYIASTRIRCARSLAGYPFNPCMTKQHYDDIEDIVNCTLSSLQGELKGKYYPLFGMKKSVQQKLVRDHFLFKAGDRFLQAANANRFWPTGRGIYHNFDKTFVVWCNEEDHIRIISMQRGGNFGEVFSRLVRGVNAIEEKIAFARDCRLGYLTFCPTNLGTTIRASVHIRLPKLSSNKKSLEEITDKYKLQVRGTRGEHSEVEGGIYDISNKRRMGLTEFEAVRELYCGITEIIEFERTEKAFPNPDPFKKIETTSAKEQEANINESKECKPNAIKVNKNSESKLSQADQKVGKKVPKK